MLNEELRPAFYALKAGGWRDYVTVLHLPYTAWNLANVAIGAALAPHLYAGRLLATLGAFFLGVGVCAHTLDEVSVECPGHGTASAATALAACASPLPAPSIKE